MPVNGVPVLMLGLTFKEDRPGLSYIHVVDVTADLHDDSVQVDIHDTSVDPTEAGAEYCIDKVSGSNAYDLTRADGAAALRSNGCTDHIFCDLKSVFRRNESDLRL